MTLRILADGNIPAVKHYLGAFGEVELVNGRTLNRRQLQAVDVLLVRSVTRVDDALLAGSPVKFVGTATSGFDHIDRDYLTREGITFAYAPGSNANSVVEYVLSAISAIGETLEQLLSGGLVGIVGYGNIGKAVAARLQALDIRYRIYDPWLEQHAIPHVASLDEVLSCDVVSLHPELTKQSPWPSYHLLGAAELQCLRSDALLINASRGAVIDNTALLAQLESGRGPTTVLDAWEGEPNISAELLQHVALGTAHIAGYSLDGKLLATRQLAEALATHLQKSLAPDVSPAGIPPVLHLPDTLPRAEFIRYLLQARYDIREDDRLLRDTVRTAHPDSSLGEQFDTLRKTYRVRRELAGSVVDGVSHSQMHSALIQALGCVPTASDGSA